jgi:hypothetical protein
VTAANSLLSWGFFSPRPPLGAQVLRRFPALCVNKICMRVWVGISPTKEQSAASQ